MNRLTKPIVILICLIAITSLAFTFAQSENLSSATSLNPSGNILSTPSEGVSRLPNLTPHFTEEVLTLNESSKKVSFNADTRKSNADKRRFTVRNICDHLRYICENLRSRRFLQRPLNQSALENLKIKRISSTKYILKSLEDDLIEIGTERHLFFSQPYLKLNKWGGEAFLKVKLPFNTNGNPQLTKDKLRYYSDKKIIEFYSKPPQEISETINGKTYTFKQNEQGGVEFDVILKEKPKSNVFIFPIQAKGLKFYYQPPLHPDHPTWVDENDDGVADCFRPENVVGSYAVYHASKQGDYSLMGGKNYRVGKAFHIYRPQIIDGNGWKVWGGLNIADGKLVVTIPQDFLDKAVYPIIVDPTFGYTTKGGSSTRLWDYRDSYRFTMGSEAGAAASITAWDESWSSSTKFKYAIYLWSDKSLIDVTQEGSKPTDVGGSWFTLPLISKSSLLANTDYILSAWANGSANNIWYDTGTSNYASYTSASYTGTYPNPLADTFNQNYKYSIYCTYAPNVRFQGVRMEGIQVR